MKILILSDIHGNLPALEAVLAVESRWDALFFLGDVVDYGPQPAPCLDFIRKQAGFCVRGNHDQALGYDVDCGCRGDFREMSVATRRWHRTLVSENDLRFLRRLPVIQSTIMDGKYFWLAHASPRGELHRYMNPKEVIAASADIDADIILVGHTHLPFLRRDGDKIFCNPGSVGLARDQGGEAEYAVWNGRNLILKRTAYDVTSVLRQLEQAPLDKTVVEQLRKVLTKE